jgi:Lipocalin-like domain
MSFARLCSALLLLMAVGTQFDTAGAQSAQAVHKLIVGTWRVIPGGVYAENPDGSRNYPLGKDAVGRVIMTAGGFAANSFQRAARGECISGTSPMNCKPEEVAGALKSAVAYQYRYSRLEPDHANPLNGRIMWSVDSLIPNWQDELLPHRYEMQRDGSKWVFIGRSLQHERLGVKVHLERERP